MINSGVYFEWMLKNGTTGLWMRNFQLYTCGMVSAFLGCFISDGKRIVTNGFFAGYNINVIVIIALLSFGKILFSFSSDFL